MSFWFPAFVTVGDSRCAFVAVVRDSTTEGLIYPFQELVEPPMALSFLATRISRMQALEPPLRLQAIPDRLLQGPQQAVARLETWIANNYPGCFLKRF